MVTPGSLSLWTCDAEVNEQILATGRRGDFPKSVELLGVMMTWGPALPGSEGDEARLYRRVAAPCFNEDTNKNVWQYGIERTAMVLNQEWRPKSSHTPEKGAVIEDVVKSCKAWVCFRRVLQLQLS